ncbi:transposase domain protein [Bordetella holmesii 04P3421]|nr:transposase domain protein [Bordetella holmesii 04P3421]KCV14920.1 transposase domain protein [Bordetella holmesii 04P3421]
MDEFALHKGHRYATVVVDPIRRQVLWIGDGRSRETARAFFEQLPTGCPADPGRSDRHDDGL